MEGVKNLKNLENLSLILSSTENTDKLARLYQRVLGESRSLGTLKIITTSSISYCLKVRKVLLNMSRHIR